MGIINLWCNIVAVLSAVPLVQGYSGRQPTVPCRNLCFRIHFNSNFSKMQDQKRQMPLFLLFVEVNTAE